MAKTYAGKFGPTARIMFKKVVSKEGKEFGRGYVEIKGSLYRIDLSRCNKEGGFAWGSMRKCEKVNSDFGGGSNRSYGGGL